MTTTMVKLIVYIHFLLAIVVVVSSTPFNANANVNVNDNDPSNTTTTTLWYDWLQKADAILQITNGTTRNFLITQGYFDIGHMFSALLNTTNQANWLTFATWASNSVGMSIRDQELADLVQEITHCPSKYIPEAECDLLKLFPDLIQDAFRPVFNHTSFYLAGGNKVVFNEIAITIAKFGYLFHNVTDIDEAAVLLEKFQSEFNETTQSRLILAVRYYWEVLYFTNITEELRDQKLLLANLLTGYQEQWHLQDYITNALPPNITIHLPFNKEIFIDSDVLSTKLLLTLATADEVFHMGKDVPPLSSTEIWPPELVDLEDPVLVQLYLECVGQLDSTANTAASNWSSLKERMRYIASLFRSRQFQSQLWQCSPFTPQQTEEIWKQQYPTGPLCIATCCNNQYL